MRGQTTIIAVVLIIMVFVALFAFLLTTAEQPGVKKHMNLYTTSLLISLLRTDTGYTEFLDKCKTVEDVLFCSHFTPSFKCGAIRCDDLADQLIQLYISKTTEPRGLNYFLKYGDKNAGNERLEKDKTASKAAALRTRGSMRLDITLWLGK